MTLALLLLFAGASVPQHACSSLSQAQVERAVNTPVSKGTERRGPSHTACDFESRAGAVSIEVHQVAATVTLDAQADALHKAFPDATFEKIVMGETPGFSMRLLDAGVQVHLLTASRRYLIVSVLGYEGAAAAAAPALAKTALDSIR